MDISQTQIQLAEPAIDPPCNLATTTSSNIWDRFFAPVDIASLVIFRICFGTVMLIEILRYFGRGWISEYYIKPTFHFTYFGFEWVRPWSATGMYLHFFVLAVLALFIMLGLWYRASMLLFFLGFTYVFLLEQARYLNHFYLISIISLLMIFVPCHRALSLDAVRRPEIQSSTVPTWALWLIRAQLGIVYFFGGVAKLNMDWLHGEPMRTWLAEKISFPVIGPLFTQEWLVYLFSNGGLLFDLLIAPLLLWRRTRAWAFIAAIGFHMLNSKLFSIGIFPWFMIAATLLFLPPNWPRAFSRFKRLAESKLKESNEKIGRNLRDRIVVVAQGVYLGFIVVVMELGRSLFKVFNRLLKSFSPPDSLSLEVKTSKLSQYLTIGLSGTFLLVQILLPLRHFLYPGNTSWTSEGHKFAWHMKLNDKYGEAKIIAIDPVTGESWEVNLADYLSEFQADAMITDPELVLQFSHFMADKLRNGENDRIEIRAEVLVSMNGRKQQLLIDPMVNLAAQPRTLMAAPWILPLTEPLPSRDQDLSQANNTPR